MDLVPLTEKVTSNISTTPENTILYGVKTNSSVEAKEYNPATDTTKNLFTVPFRETTIRWGSRAEGPHFIHPMAAGNLNGFVFQATNGTLTRLPADGFGLSAAGNESMVIYGEVLQESYQTSVLNPETGNTVSIPIDIVPDKCTNPNNTRNLICASSGNQLNHTMPDGWYKGLTVFNDNLWKVGPLGTMTLLVHVEEHAGRQLDAHRLLTNQSGSNLYFLNKNDQTLWLYDLLPFEN
jgi:hypothetical protein